MSTCVWNKRKSWVAQRSDSGGKLSCPVNIERSVKVMSALAITQSHQQNTHDFADGRKNMNDIFNNYVCSASHMPSGLHFQNV